MNRDRPQLTEAEYALWASGRMDDLATLITGLLPQEMRDAGLHFAVEDD